MIAGQVIFFGLAVLYLHLNGGKWIKVVQIGGLVALLGLGHAAAVRVVLLSQAFGSPSVKLADEGEKEWNFGQLLSLLLLVLPAISAVEILRGEFLVTVGHENCTDGCTGEMNVPAPLPDDQAVTLLGKDNELHEVRASFQPNPFWGNQQSRFSKW